MNVINGTYGNATIFTTKNPNNAIDQYAITQLQMLCDHPASKGSKICVMPDVHPGKVCTIGLTMTVGDIILPNIVGIDIGCGMTLAKIKDKRCEFQRLDTVIRENIPSGFQIRKKAHRYAEEFDITRLYCAHAINTSKAMLSLGTLGGGNHFIEIDKDENSSLYIVIHSGSRHLGKEVTDYYLAKGQELLKTEGKNVPYELTYLTGTLRDEYLHDLQVVQDYATLNRNAMLQELVKGMKWKITESYSCIHNYVEPASTSYCKVPILRKGAISAKAGESVIIPVNMRDGIILATGLGNENWNVSAPHGAGRINKREEIRNSYTVSAFKKEMKGVYSSCIGKDTLDEAPFAYRPLEDIKEVIKDTVTINQILSPIYNFKAGGKI